MNHKKGLKERKYTCSNNNLLISKDSQGEIKSRNEENVKINLVSMVKEGLFRIARLWTSRPEKQLERILDYQWRRKLFLKQLESCPLRPWALAFWNRR